MKEYKIGLVTLHGYFNYGNRLQNYALKYTLEKMGYVVDTTVLRNDELTQKMRIKKLKLNLKANFTEVVSDVRTIIFNRLNNSTTMNPLEQNREVIFKEFSETYLNEKFYNLSDTDNLTKINNYSFFITGSDQVWNPLYYNYLPIYFLSFVPQRKRIAYSPSISVDSLPDQYVNDYTKWFNGMHKLSIREQEGANIIESQIGIEVPVLVDPTMLLTKEEWLTISKRASNRPNTPYLLTYFLGGPTNETREKINRLAEENNMTVINLEDQTEKDTYETGPSEFIDYINNASVLFTDSFHGLVFSIIFQTPFIVYERISSGPSMYSRIETLLDKFGLKDREINNFEGDIFEMDFSGTFDILAQEYTESIDYLKSALGTH